MKVSREWLGEFVELEDVSPERITDLLTLSGTEVARVETFAAGLDQVVVAEVVELDRISGSDHLWLARVRIPDQDPQEVVCGAPNLVTGARVAWARPGTHLPGGLELGQRKIRGIVSHGMLCAPDELGLGSDHEGVLLLPSEEVELGQPLSRVFPADTIYELEILSNRGDCLSHWGVARELAAVLDRPLRDPSQGLVARTGLPARESVAVRIEVDRDCPIYLAECLEQSSATTTPLWVRRRLMAVGSRPISAVVDLANYVMLELGQPVHTFDLDRMPGRPGQVQIGVRPGRVGESLDCLDGIARRLDPESLVITAADRPVALAGVIGGSQTAVQPGTRRIVLEVANFNWISIRRTSRRLGVRSEASSRFERSLSATLVPVAAGRFLHLFGQVLGGEVRPGPVRAGELPQPPAPIEVTSKAISQLIGLEVSADLAAATLRRLQFGVEVATDQLLVTPVAFRTDVRIPEDVTEEVGRILGYDRVPATLPALRSAPTGSPGLTSAARLAGEVCLGAGFTEALTSSLVSQGRPGPVLGLGAGMAPTRLANPLSSQLGSLRASCLPGLFEASLLNQSRGQERTRLFEWGRVFWGQGEVAVRPQEPELLALVDHAASPAAEDVSTRVDRLLQLVQGLGERIGLDLVEFRPGRVAGFHPLRSTEVWCAGQLRGVLGQLDGTASAELELRGTTVAAELRVDGWLIDGGRPGRGAELGKTPPLTVDLAVTVPERAQLGPALTAVRGARIAELEELRLVDQYRGAQLPAGTKGWTFRLRFRHPQRTLTHREGEELRSRVLAELAAGVGAEVRLGSA